MHACRHARTEVVRWFLDLGVCPGADPSIRDELFQVDADGWLRIFSPLAGMNRWPSKSTT